MIATLDLTGQQHSIDIQATLKSPMSLAEILPDPQRPRRRKITTACLFCRTKKIRCDGDDPCGNCQTYSARCRYVKRHLGTNNIIEAPSKSSRVSRRSQDQSAGLEQDKDPNEAAPGAVRKPAPSFQFVYENGVEGTLPSEALENTAARPLMQDQGPQLFLEHTECPQEVDSSEIRALTSPATTRDCHDMSSKRPEVIEANDEDQAFPDYYGPGSFLSICSKPAVEWVCQTTGVPDFALMAKKLIDDISERPEVLIDMRKGPIGLLELEPQGAWDYVRAFFEIPFSHSENFLLVVPRTYVECRLRAHIEGVKNGIIDDDLSWYALRNAIYATGCRSYLLAREPNEKFRIAVGHGWQYFQRAMSVHVELVYKQASLMTLQALVVLMNYCESLNSPTLVDILCSSAMRIAIAKGLHRQPSPSMGLDEATIQSRNAVWWVLYAFERHYAFTWGRPVSIDEQSITAQVPTVPLPGATFDLEEALPVIKQARIWWHINKTYTRLKLFNSGLQDIVASVSDLENRLDQSLRGIPPRFRPPKDSSEPEIASETNIVHYLGMVFTYLGSLIQIHSILVYPWNGLCLDGTPEQADELRKHRSRSTKILVNSSRKILQHLRFIPINATTPKWLCIYYPLMASINIFIHALQSPDLSSMESDRQLLLAVSGHFSYIHFVCPEIDIQFVTGLVNLMKHTAMRLSAVSEPVDPAWQDNLLNLFNPDDLALPFHGGSEESLLESGELRLDRPDQSMFFNAMFEDDEQWYVGGTI